MVDCESTSPPGSRAGHRQHACSEIVRSGLPPPPCTSWRQPATSLAALLSAPPISICLRGLPDCYQRLPRRNELCSGSGRYANSRCTSLGKTAPLGLAAAAITNLPGAPAGPPTGGAAAGTAVWAPPRRRRHWRWWQQQQQPQQHRQRGCWCSGGPRHRRPVLRRPAGKIRSQGGPTPLPWCWLQKLAIPGGASPGP